MLAAAAAAAITIKQLLLLLWLAFACKDKCRTQHTLGYRGTDETAAIRQQLLLPPKLCAAFTQVSIAVVVRQLQLLRLLFACRND
jgi:hypothetical protein